ncbi:MAG: EAL domain-containing protein [Desulforhopalus sp.]
MYFFQKMSIKYQLIVWCVLAFTVVVIVSGWIIYSLIHETTGQLASNQLCILIGPVLISALAFILLFSIYISGMITRPLTKLVRQMNEGNVENLESRADENAPGEVGMLARKFNHYSMTIQSSNKELENEINARVQTEEQLKLFAKVFEHALEGISIADVDGNIIAVNNSFTRITGYQEAEVLGQNPRVLKSDRHESEFYRNMWQRLQEDGYWSGEIWNRKKNGEIYPVVLSINTIRESNGTISHYVAVFNDITEKKLKEDKIQYQAYHDALTRLPNRYQAKNRLEKAIRNARKSRTKVGVLYLDLDHFKNINDSLGHAIGDRLLQEIGKRLVQTVQEKDLVGRLGGDEFLVITEGITSDRQLIELAERLKTCFSQPFLTEGHELKITASIGVTLCPDDGENVITLAKNSDMAMYRSKEQGRNSYSFFVPEMSENILRRMELEKDLKQAIEEKQFSMFFQPKVCPQSNKVVGLEALVRWIQPDGTLINPADFIPLAEETGLIIPLGELVLEESCLAIQQLDALGLEQMSVAVNLSPVQFEQSNLVSRVISILDQHGISPSRLELEITETTMMTNIDNCIATLNLLVEKGISISIDDFGTGYSSLYYLKNLPINTLKIDRSFIKNITRNSCDARIVETIILMAQKLGINVIPEGVETGEQLHMLSNFGCSQVQGFYYSKPLPLEDLIRYLRQSEKSWTGSKPLLHKSLRSDLMHSVLEKISFAV